MPQIRLRRSLHLLAPEIISLVSGPQIRTQHVDMVAKRRQFPFMKKENEKKKRLLLLGPSNY